MASTYNILMYSHDTYGLGHIRRTLAIATHLREKQVNILILTGSPIVGRFDFPPGIDFVRIPGMIKQTNEEYLPHSIRVNPGHALNIRKDIITATAQAFNPKLFIVDKAPLGLKQEIMPTLRWFKKTRPDARVILGLRDVMDDAESTRREWREKGVYDVLDMFYTEIWVYGQQELYDPVTEYDIPETTSHKMVFTGYIPRQVPGRDSMGEIRREQKLRKKDRLVVVTTGGGGDGYKVLDIYMKMLESQKEEAPYRTVMIAGPFMPSEQVDELASRAKAINVGFCRFFSKIERIMAAADLVVCMGGYNTICEVLSLKKASLIIPRYTPRLEQLIRAQVLYKAGLVDYLKWDDLNPGALSEKVLGLLENSEPYIQSIEQFPLTGLSVIKERLAAFRGKKP